jgi:hypothetical protein
MATTHRSFYAGSPILTQARAERGVTRTDDSPDRRELRRTRRQWAARACSLGTYVRNGSDSENLWTNQVKRTRRIGSLGPTGDKLEGGKGPSKFQKRRKAANSIAPQENHTHLVDRGARAAYGPHGLDLPPAGRGYRQALLGAAWSKTVRPLVHSAACKGALQTSGSFALAGAQKIAYAVAPCRHSSTSFCGAHMEASMELQACLQTPVYRG